MTYDIFEAAQLLSLTPDALRRKARRTGIGKLTPGSKRWAFTGEEVSRLRSNAVDRRYKPHVGRSGGSDRPRGGR